MWKAIPDMDRAELGKALAEVEGRIAEGVNGHGKAARLAERREALKAEIEKRSPVDVEDWEDARPITVLHICAPNSPSGNPRRCYAVLQRSRVLAVIDEGYEGTGALRRAGWGDAVGNIVGDVDVKVNEYKRWLTRGNADRAVA
jgi:hypothetical protein